MTKCGGEVRITPTAMFTLRDRQKTPGAMSHRELCERGAKYVKNHGLYPYHRAQYVVCELERVGECPDVFGFGGTATLLVEVKVSRSDFLSDKKKSWRRTPAHGLGEMRSYLCPAGLIRESELPPFWGLLYADERGSISVVKYPESQACDSRQEMQLAASILRREGIKPQVFSYKKYRDVHTER